MFSLETKNTCGITSIWKSCHLSSVYGLKIIWNDIIIQSKDLGGEVSENCHCARFI